MPTYEYVCDSCSHKFEHFQMMSATPLKKCPQCTKMKLRRLIGTGAGIIFKGSGFYETDYRGDGYKKAQEGDKGTPAAAPEAPKAAETKSETPKTDSPAPSKPEKTSTTKKA